MVGILLNHAHLPVAGRRGWGDGEHALHYPSRYKLFGRFGGSGHERQVAMIALRMFDLLAAEHGLGARYRELLKVGALVHDAAKPRGAANHHVRGAELVLADRTITLTARQRRSVAYLVRYHRGPVADVDRILCPGDRRRKMRVLLALLRAADALDSEALSATAIVMRRKGRRLRIDCLVDSDLEEARRRFCRPEKFELLEKLLGLRAQVRIRRALPQSAH